VPEYDAFGREIGENTLAGLGGESQPRREPVPREEPAARVETPPEQPDASRVTLSVPKGAPITVIPGRRRRTGGLGCFVGVVILAAVVVGPVIGLVSFVGSATDVIEDAFDPETLPLPGELLGPPPVGITGESMIAPANLSAALGQIRDEDYRRVTAIDLRPDRVTFTVVRNGRERDLVVDSDGDLTTGGGPSPAPGGAGTIGLGAIDPAAPARLVRGAAKRYRVRPRGINYVLAGPERGGGHHWRAYFKNGVYVEGDAAGRVIRRFDGG
jgi:hypothetical protein